MIGLSIIEAGRIAYEGVVTVADIREHYAERLDAIADAVRAIHVPFEGEGEDGSPVSWCATCSDLDDADGALSLAWPCPTWSAVFGSEAPPPQDRSDS